MNETGDELQSLTIVDVSYVAQTLLISVLWAHIVIHNPFERDQWAFGAARWFVDIGPVQLWWGFHGRNCDPQRHYRAEHAVALSFMVYLDVRCRALVATPQG